MKKSDYLFPLFVPANRPDRIVKAWGSGADSVIIDLEDAVAPADKVMAREHVREAMQAKPDVRTYLRINACDTVWHLEDVALLTSLDFEGVMLPKTQTAAELKALRSGLQRNQTIIGLIETARGLANVNDLAQHCDRLAFGSIDYCLDLDMEHTETTLLLARSAIVLASRLAEILPPLDGVTTATGDEALIEREAAHSSALGFKGKLLIHPSQRRATYRGFVPSEAALAWAENIVQAAGKSGAVTVEGHMVDAPVIKKAHKILARRDLLK